MGHATFTYTFYENEGTKTGISLPANAVHSVDAYILRCMHRRCNYDVDMVEKAKELIEIALANPNVGSGVDVVGKVTYYIAQYVRSTLADIVILPHLDGKNIYCLSTKHLKQLLDIINSMLLYKPFELVTIHDSFASHANNVNYVRQNYINILAELAESNLLDDILSQLHGTKGTFTKLSSNLGELIRGSEYALS